MLKQALKEEINRYQEIAKSRYDDSKNTSLMIGADEHKIRSEVMRRNIVQQLKNKHMHDFRRKIVDGILKEREKLPGYSPSMQKQ